MELKSSGLPVMTMQRMLSSDVINFGGSIKCVVSLLRDAIYRWWKTLISVVPKERVTWDFFQVLFWKKYISERVIDQK
ncbi:Gag-Pol polyprotein [Gossypium australe]|uniref:Gag-Pol polyprotein n=1 Tax=Gossypium australe TaxID=47621 RepID=A0A5B6X162_9ROSI|nr:Gag-Pol polyprotein [Gossypium australe]